MKTIEFKPRGRFKMMWEDYVNHDLRVMEINHCNKQAKPRNEWQQTTEQVN
jgi:hypothetical protein